MTDTEQFDIINTTAWYDAMRAQAQAILGAMSTTHFTVKDGWVVTEVQKIHSEFKVNGNEVTLKAGQKADGSPLYTWVFPAGWVAPGTTP